MYSSKRRDGYKESNITELNSLQSTKRHKVLILLASKANTSEDLLDCAILMTFVVSKSSILDYPMSPAFDPSQ